MSREAPADADIISDEELTELIAPRPRGGRLRRLSAVPPRSISLP